MPKLILLIALGCIVWRMAKGRWPWQPKALAKGAGAGAPSFETAQARALLGVDSGASRREIVEAHRRRLAAVHPDRGGSSEQVHETNAARDVLLGQLPAEV